MWPLKKKKINLHEKKPEHKPDYKLLYHEEILTKNQWKNWHQQQEWEILQLRQENQALNIELKYYRNKGAQ